MRRGRKIPDHQTTVPCHPVQGATDRLARDLDIPLDKNRARAGDINRMAFYLRVAALLADGAWNGHFPALKRGCA